LLNNKDKEKHRACTVFFRDSTNSLFTFRRNKYN